MKGKEPKRKGWMGTLAALLGAGVFLFSYPTVGPLLEALLGRATLLSAAFAMPEGALETLRQRYSPELYEDLPDDPPDQGLLRDRHEGHRDQGHRCFRCSSNWRGQKITGWT